MKKIILIILSSIILVSTKTIYVNAAVSIYYNWGQRYNADYIYLVRNGDNWYVVAPYSKLTVSNNKFTGYLNQIFRMYGYSGGTVYRYDLPGYIECLTNDYIDGTVPYCLQKIGADYYQYEFDELIVYYGSINKDSNSTVYDSYQDYEDAMNPPLEWWQLVWDTFADYLTNPVLGQWMDNLIYKIWGDDNEGTIAQNVDIGAPTLAPTPTPIPYSTVVVPRTDIISGDIVYETNYYYENPDGTPTVAPYPPTNSPANDGGGNGNSYTPINGEPFSIPRLNWLTSVDVGDDNYNGIDSIYEGIGSIDSIGSEYTDGLSAAQDATGTLPDSWLLLIGVAAAIPLIAGVISRFLS